MKNRTALAIRISGLMFIAYPLVANSEPTNKLPTTQGVASPGGQSPNGQSVNPAQITNRDTNQPALRQKQEISNTSPDFPTAMNPANNDSPTKKQMPSPTTTSVTSSVTTRMSDPRSEAADNAVQQAQSIFDHQRQKVIFELGNEPAYQAAIARRDAASAKLPVIPSTTGPSQTVLHAADEKLDASQAVTQMQQAALEADPTASSAKVQLQRAIRYRDRLSHTASTQP